MGSSQPVPVPDDIAERIKQEFSNAEETKIALEFVNEIHRDSSPLNVGPSQFCRAIIVLAEGDIQEFNRLASIVEDPRDTLMELDARLGNPKDYGMKPFDEMKD